MGSNQSKSQTVVAKNIDKKTNKGAANTGRRDCMQEFETEEHDHYLFERNIGEMSRLDK